MKKDKEVTLSSGITFDCVDPMFPEFTEGIANLVDVVIRPEDFYVDEEAEGRINGEVISLIFKGVHYEMIVKSDDGIEWLVQNVDPFKVGSRVGLYVDPDDIQIMRRSELSPEFGSFGLKHPAAEESSEAKEIKANSIGENVVEEGDVKKDEDAEDAEVETADK
jgi:spermidine/putrescine transport system ATP-binding protein